jgi:16S rRNA (adenine1518-N6/adenine1519-N6)-dimethyltransferase
MLKAKKSLGQNFLRSEKAVRDIVDSLSGEVRQVVEIGGGEGVVTKALLEKGFLVTVVELDTRAVDMMSESLQNYIKSGKLEIINQDILKTNLSSLVKGEDYALVGNIPYYITGLILRHIFEQEILPKEVTLMVQKEVADRILARNGKESILSLSIKAYGEVSLVSVVKRGSFSPAPKVDSAIFHVKNIQNPFQKNLVSKELGSGEESNLEKRFFEIIKTAFRHPRKVAMGNLKKYLDEPTFLKVEKVLVANDCQNKRAEDIPLFVWKYCIN